MTTKPKPAALTARLADLMVDPRGDDRYLAYRRQIDGLLQIIREHVVELGDAPTDLWEIRRQLREVHGLPDVEAAS